MNLEDVKTLSDEEFLEEFEDAEDVDLKAQPDLLKAVIKRLETPSKDPLEKKLVELSVLREKLKRIETMRMGGSLEDREKGLTIGDNMRRDLAKISAGDLLYMIKGRNKDMFNPELLRFLSIKQYLELMKSNAISDPVKEEITKARYKFAERFINSGEMKRYHEKNKEYHDDLTEWLKDPSLPQPVKPNLPVPPEVKERFRNELKDGVDELSYLNQYWPELFDAYEAAGHIRFGIIQKLKQHEDFSGRGRYIREAKVTDFIEIIKHVEDEGVKQGKSLDYFKAFSPAQLKGLRDQLKGPIEGKSKDEYSGMGGRAWSSPLTMDFYNRDRILSFSKSDDGDRKMIVKHIITAWAYEQKTGKNVMSNDNRDALQWLRQKTAGHSFYVLMEVIEEVEREVGFADGELKEMLDSKIPIQQAGGKDNNPAAEASEVPEEENE